jgi:hypothetical protein
VLLLIGQLGIGDFNHFPCHPRAGLERLVFSRPEDFIGTIISKLETQPAGPWIVAVEARERTRGFMNRPAEVPSIRSRRSGSQGCCCVT